MRLITVSVIIYPIKWIHFYFYESCQVSKINVTESQHNGNLSQHMHSIIHFIDKEAMITCFRKNRRRQRPQTGDTRSAWDGMKKAYIENRNAQMLINNVEQLLVINLEIERQETIGSLTDCMHLLSLIFKYHFFLIHFDVFNEKVLLIYSMYVYSSSLLIVIKLR